MLKQWLPGFQSEHVQNPAKTISLSKNYQSPYLLKDSVIWLLFFHSNFIFYSSPLSFTHITLKGFLDVPETGQIHSWRFPLEHSSFKYLHSQLFHFL